MSTEVILRPPAKRDLQGCRGPKTWTCPPLPHKIICLGLFFCPEELLTADSGSFSRRACCHSATLADRENVCNPWLRHDLWFPSLGRHTTCSVAYADRGTLRWCAGIRGQSPAKEIGHENPRSQGVRPNIGNRTTRLARDSSRWLSRHSGRTACRGQILSQTARAVGPHARFRDAREGPSGPLPCPFQPGIGFGRPLARIIHGPGVRVQCVFSKPEAQARTTRCLSIACASGFHAGVNNPGSWPVCHRFLGATDIASAFAPPKARQNQWHSAARASKVPTSGWYASRRCRKVANLRNTYRAANVFLPSHPAQPIQTIRPAKCVQPSETNSGEQS